MQPVEFELFSFEWDKHNIEHIKKFVNNGRINNNVT